MLPISVIIPTMGVRNLKPTLDSLFNGSHMPGEILLCVPTRNAQLIQKYCRKNIKIIECSNKGQVIQRIEGFKRARYDFVLQLDDDIILDYKCLSVLYESILYLGQDCAISPQYFDIVSGKHSSTFSSKKIFLFPKLFYYLLNGKDGFIDGRISKSGLNMGVTELNDKYYLSDWLPGGCILHHKENLILKNYLPFKGKAYAEDVIHSYYLKKSNVKLYVISKAKIYMNCYNNSTNYLKSFFEYINSIKFSYYAASLYGSNYLRYRICTYYYLFNLIIIKIFKISQD